ncbi:hypothetical protein AWJ20_684 [Sugiyamaella lignohabitans]|uniref:Uncharacterized protein n=1 Tax=Sugiyamaella lignohabitans TaxID=796027 RepID=A0A167D3E1_9ASCO|nr:uncharacterized protein AWJ20_684 [Sugiyamaella lignohabitans]ANB12431.1 hypothetical protein AWJ20_684 [Sugiyamaella lignohabitans]
MNVKEVDKLSAQFAVSLSEATGLIASWLDDDDDVTNPSNGASRAAGNDSDDEIYESLGLKQLRNSRAGLGSVNTSSIPFRRDPVFDLNSRGTSTTGLGSRPGQPNSNLSSSQKALQAIKKKHPHTSTAQTTSQPTPTTSLKPHNPDSDSDSDGRSSLRTTAKRTSTSFLDSYKKNKKSRR